MAVVAVAGLLAAACSVVGVRSGTEEPPFTVVEQIAPGIEIRRYAPRLAAETDLGEADSNAARSKAFGRLFDYISGANAPAAKIAMTAPVETATSASSGGAEEIAMTAPVEIASAGSDRMRFFLPVAMSLPDAPVPTDPAVRLIELPVQDMAVLRYTGSTAESDTEIRSQELLTALAATDWRPEGNPVAYFYDPPWTLPPFRRNEVAVPVRQRP
ncbi:MAG: heme-binding protein [Pseudomonadota bacterium]